MECTNQPLLCLLQEQCQPRFQQTSWAKWVVDSVKWRSALQMPKGYHPYSTKIDQQPRAAGFSGQPSKRVLDLLDCAAVELCKRRKISVTQAKPALKDVLIDVSQSHIRRPFSDDRNIARCLTTSSRLFNFGQARMVSALEHLLLQGYDRSVEVPRNVGPSDLRSMAGEGIALPCLATIMWAVLLTQKF